MQNKVDSTGSVISDLSDSKCFHLGYSFEIVLRRELSNVV